MKKNLNNNKDYAEVMKAWEYHKSCFGHDWLKGEPTEWWRDEDKNLCVKYENGDWYCYIKGLGQEYTVS